MSDKKNDPKEFRKAMAVSPKNPKRLTTTHPRAFVPKKKDFFETEESIVKHVYTDHIRD